MSESGRGSLKFYSSKGKSERESEEKERKTTTRRAGNPFQSFCMHSATSETVGAPKLRIGENRKEIATRRDARGGGVKSSRDRGGGARTSEPRVPSVGGDSRDGDDGSGERCLNV